MNRNVNKQKGRRLVIDNPSGRSMEEKGFDDMAALTTGYNESTNATPNDEPDIENDYSYVKSFQKAINKEKKAKVRTILILGIVIAVCITAIVCTYMVVEHRIEQTDGKIKVNYASDDLEGIDYKEAISDLQKQGFTNITTSPDKDLITGWITKDGEVEEVSIDGSTSFSSGSRFLPNAEIVITYHTFPDEEK